MSKIFLILLISGFISQFVFSDDSQECADVDSQNNGDNSSASGNSSYGTTIIIQNKTDDSSSSDDTSFGSIITFPFRLPIIIIRDIIGFIGVLVYGVFSSLARLSRLIFGSLFLSFTSYGEARDIMKSGDLSDSRERR